MRLHGCIFHRGMMQRYRDRASSIRKDIFDGTSFIFLLRARAFSICLTIDQVSNYNHEAPREIVRTEKRDTALPDGSKEGVLQALRYIRIHKREGRHAIVLQIQVVD